MRVEIWSDVVCPWCYIGKRRFETALANVGAGRDISSIEVVYRPFQLDPKATPGTPQPVVEAYARKFGGPEQAAQIIAKVTSVAAADGLEFNMDIALRANTLLAHRLLWFAEQDAEQSAEQSAKQSAKQSAEQSEGRRHSRQHALKERLLRAYFTEGKNIGDPDTLTACAVEVGLDGDRVRRFLDSGEGHGEVMELLAAAASSGITAVPTYVFNDQWAVPGAQEPAVFERVLHRLLDSEAAETCNA